jgi:hypothetical protein
MKSLREIMIGGAQLSDDAIQKLHGSLPDAEIYVDGRRR